jgi:RNA polymerase sigma factor for flagellar operon FliA
MLGLSPEDLRFERITAYCGSMDLPLTETQDFARLVRDLRESLLEGMSNLPDDQKVVMALSYYEGLTSTEISKVVSKDEGMVSQLHADAMETLKKLMLNRV